jgi:integrase
LSFILEFWTEGSEYCQKKIRRRKPLSQSYLYNNTRLIENHFAPVLKGRCILDLNPALIEVQVSRLSKKGIGPRTINQGLQAITVPVRWFCRMHRIAYPLEWLEKETEFPKERGVLSMAELGKIIASKGKIGGEPRSNDQKHGPGKSDIAPNQYATILLGALCGLRAGEVRGLQFDDVDTTTGVIHILHNWVDSEGLKEPKQGSTKTVPAPEPVLQAIEMCRAFTYDPFVFYNIRSNDMPGLMGTLTGGFKKVLRALGISKEGQERRVLVFHGLRHLFVSLYRSTRIVFFFRLFLTELAKSPTI